MSPRRQQLAIAYRALDHRSLTSPVQQGRGGAHASHGPDQTDLGFQMFNDHLADSSLAATASSRLV